MRFLAPLLTLLLPSLLVAQGYLVNPYRFAASAGGGGGPIVFDASSGTSWTGSASWTNNHTFSGTNRVAFVGVAWDTTATGCSVTCGGVAATELWDFANVELGNIAYSAGYAVVNPGTGSQEIIVTLTGGTPGAAAVGVVSFYGGDTNSPTRTAATASGNTGTTTVTASGATTGDIVVDCAGVFSTAITVGANQTSRNEQDNFQGNNMSLGISTQAGADGGVMTWTQTLTFWASGAVAFKPAP